jgi:hypothetical protein
VSFIRGGIPSRNTGALYDRAAGIGYSSGDGAVLREGKPGKHKDHGRHSDAEFKASHLSIVLHSHSETVSLWGSLASRISLRKEQKL